MNSETLVMIMGAIIALLIVGFFLYWLKASKHIHEQDKKDGIDEKALLKSSLKKEQLRSQAILNDLEDGIVLVDTSGVIQLFNPSAGKISGWKVEEAVGLDHKTIMPIADADGNKLDDASNPFVQVLASKETVRNNDLTVVTRTYTNVPVSLIVTPLIDQSTATLIGAIAVIRDTTKDKAQEKQRADFISTASHEMRTPIAAIDGYLALALNDKTVSIPDSTKNYLEKARAATQHLGTLFQDLLTSSKAEDGRISNHPVVIEVGELLQQATDDARFNAEKKELQLEYLNGVDGNSGQATVAPLFYVYADPDRMKEVVHNLIDNGIKYTQYGKISVILSGDTQNVQIQIKDTGPGIAEDDRQHLFQKFYRVDNSFTRTIGGTGLGLYICRKIIELYNGKIWVESEVGKGSSFNISLPRLSNEKALEMKKAQEDGSFIPAGSPASEVTQSPVHATMSETKA